MATALRYSKVSRRIWGDERFQRLTPAPPNGQTLWLRLLTGPELTVIPGLFAIGEAALSEALGWPLEGFRKAFAEVSREGMVKADWKARLVWVPKALSHNRPESPNVVRSWGSVFAELPDSPLKTEAYQALKAFVEGMGEGFGKAFRQAFPEAFAKPSPNQEQEQEQEQEQDPEMSIPGLSAKSGVAHQEPLLLTIEAPPAVDVVTTVFAAYTDERAKWLKGAAPKLTAERRKLIRDRATDFPIERLVDAVRGVWRSEYHRTGGFTSLELALRNAEKIERFAAIGAGDVPAARRPLPPGGSYGDYGERFTARGNFLLEDQDLVDAGRAREASAAGSPLPAPRVAPAASSTPRAASGASPRPRALGGPLHAVSRVVSSETHPLAFPEPEGALPDDELAELEALADQRFESTGTEDE